MYGIWELGDKLCGHPGIIHGGCIASIFDQFFGMIFVCNAGRGFTANLNINYLKPTLINQSGKELY